MAPPPTLWLLDDSPTEADFIRAALSATCRIFSFTDGAVLLEVLGHQAPPDVVVLDWEMPGLSGIEVCEYLRSNPATAALPVLLLTSHQTAEDVMRGMEAGANDYVFKPFRPLELAARVHALVRRDTLRKRALADEHSRRVLAEDSLVVVQAAEERAWRAEAERTQLLEREQQARRQVEVLAAETRQHAEFERKLLGIVSHDLRNPLSAITLTAASLMRHTADERQQRGLQRILLSAERAVRLVRDLLDFTRARQGGGIAVQRKAADLHELVRAAVEEARAARPDRSIGVAQSGDGTGSWDPNRLEQVVANLIGNALQYSPPHTPVQVETQGEEDSVVLKVHNLGTPIPAERLPRIFEPMERGTDSVDRAGGSIGLGLYIVRHIVLAHAGTVSIQSTATEGTTFTVRLPRHPPASPD
ncbi:response regulator [Stigmatella sp. ncwal1]|uniref:histidine kinase n=1 Tax=Stigmatella ashevillensis TaxID=2995309 RepID=A0ABT5DE77_9BACT|nr:ATP-binding protein [Stigmatella ashevillena]MDC0711889.1 response regulator [Stigmatella ashevillena]